MAALYANESAAATGITFDDAEVRASFTVDAPRRMISGLIIPWHKVARSGFAKWRFEPRSLHWSDASRIKLNTNHDHTQAIAKAISITNTSAGLDATFKVARGEEGDKALALAEDGVLDGFSVEVDFDDGDGLSPDPSDENVRLVKSGKLAGVALTGFPAFDDARVQRVAAARQGGKMTEEDAVQMDGDKPEATFETAMERLANTVSESQEKLSQSIGDSVSAGIEAAMERIGTPQQGPTPVRAAKYRVTREEPVYRFDGSGDFLVRDAWKAVFEKGTHSGDDALER